MNQGRSTVPGATELLVQSALLEGGGLRRHTRQALYTAQVELTRPVAAHKVAMRDFFPGRSLGPAGLESVGTARMEVTARGRIGGVGHLTL
jgi:hypothetical protein